MDRIIKSALVALYPGAGRLKGIDETNLGAYLERFRREAPPLMRAGVTAASILYMVSPPLTIRKLLPAFMLSAEERDLHAHKLATHPLYAVRTAVLALKMAAGLCWGADPEVREALGLRPLESDPGTWRRSGEPS